MSTIGRKLLSAALYSGNVHEFMELSLAPVLFKESEGVLYSYIKEHLQKYGKLPSPSTIEEQPGLEGALVDAPEPPEFYLQGVERRYLQNSMKAFMNEAGAVLKEEGGDPMQAFDILLNGVSNLNRHRNRHNLIDFRDSAELIYDEYVKQKTMGDDYGLMFGWPSVDEMTGGLKPGDFASFVGRPASGKAQPLTAKVLTPTGWTTMGALRVGDKLASVDGIPSEVLEIFPQGQKPVFRLTFQDGRSCEAADEHLWEVWYREWPSPRILTTVQIIALLSKSRYQKRLSVRLFNGDYGTHLTTLFSPYVLGLLIGDGCFRGSSPMFSTEDPGLVEALNSELEKFDLKAKHTDRCNYRICGSDSKVNVLREWLKDMGLWGLLSEEKFLPSWTFRMSREQRVGLLQGLMDSDGTACKEGGVSFCTSSPRLASDVQQLVWSLGGRATISPKKTKGLLAYILHIVFKDRASVFRLDRKASRVSQPRTSHTNTRLRIESVEFVRMDECQCISVSHPDRLYVTDNYVVTHNTFKLLYNALHTWGSNKTPLFFSMEMAKTVIMQRMAAMHAHKPLTHLMKAEMTTKAFTAMMEILKKVKEKQESLWIVDGNLATTVDDIIMLTRQLKPSAIYVDGAYLLRHPNPRTSRFERQTENAEWLKQRVATDLGIPVVASYQFGKEMVKKQKASGAKAGLEDIYGSDAIAQLSTMVFGLMQEDSVETQKERVVEILKGRNGETGRFKINWDFQGMDFSEKVSQEDEEELMFCD